MKSFSAALKAAAVILIFALLYGVSLPFRPLFAPDEYDFALLLMRFFPEISGNTLPKLPALAATMLCAGTLWAMAERMRLLLPWNAPVIYLLLPPVWYFGTSAQPVQIIVLSITLTVMLIFLARKSDSKTAQIFLYFSALLAAAATAVLGKSFLFSWAAIPMAILPILSLQIAVKLEKLDDRNRAGKVLDRISCFLAFLLLTALALLLAAPLCRCFNLSYPGFLTIYPPGRSLFVPTVALTIPLLWYFMSCKIEKFPGKLQCIAAGTAFLMLALPPVLPWNRFLHNMPGSAVAGLAKEINPAGIRCFSDRNFDAVLAYEWRIPVTVIGRRKGELHPDELKNAINKALSDGDAIVALSNNDYDTFLPQKNRIVYTSGSNRRIIRYSGEKK